MDHSLKETELDIDRQIKEVRDEFPILRYKTYMNSAAHGPALRRVWDAVQDWWRFRMCEDRGARTPDAKGEAARLLHADPDEICWTSRVSQGLNMVASMLDLERGDNVVVTDLAYPSNVYVWLPFRQRGVEIRRIRHRDGRIETADFERAIDDGTRVLCISHVEWTSGLKYDVKALAEIAHAHGAFLVDDPYQALGAIDVDAHCDEVDFLATGSEKWLCCPSLAGIFYVRRELVDAFEPTYRLYELVDGLWSHGAPWERPDHDNLADYDRPLVSGAEKFYRGCVSGDAVWGFHAALSYFNELGAKQIGRRVRRLSGYLIDGLRELGVKVNTPLEPEERAGLVTYTTGRHGLDAESYRALLGSNIVVALRYAAEIGGIRVSTHFFNTEEEIDRLLKVQKVLLT